MSIHPYTATDEQVQRKFAKGLGRGCGTTYLPFLTQTDVRQRKGDMRRIKCTLSRRVVTLFSPLARLARLALEQSGNYVAIDEYVPLDPQLVRAAASKLEICVPRNEDGQPRVLMATLRATSATVQGKQEAFLVCSTSQLADFNTIVELELQRLAWGELGVPVKVITDSEECLPAALRHNLEALVPHRTSPELEPSPGYHEWLEQQVLEEVLGSQDAVSLHDFVQVLDTKFSVPAGTCINAALRLIWRRRIRAALCGDRLHEQLVVNLAERSQA